MSIFIDGLAYNPPPNLDPKWYMCDGARTLYTYGEKPVRECPEVELAFAVIQRALLDATQPIPRKATPAAYASYVATQKKRGNEFRDYHHWKLEWARRRGKTLRRKRLALAWIRGRLDPENTFPFYCAVIGCDPDVVRDGFKRIRNRSVLANARLRPR